MPTPPQRLAIASSKKKLAAMILGSAAFVLACAFLWHVRPSLVIRAVAVVGTAFFGFWPLPAGRGLPCRGRTRPAPPRATSGG